MQRALDVLRAGGDLSRLAAAYDRATPSSDDRSYLDRRIADLARLVAEVVGFSGRIVFDANRPDGTPRKLLDCALMRALGWAPRIALRAGIADAYADFLARHG